MHNSTGLTEVQLQNVWAPQARHRDQFVSDPAELVNSADLLWQRAADRPLCQDRSATTESNLCSNKFEYW